MGNIAPIRTQTEIAAIINNAYHALSQLSIQIVAEEKQGIDMTDPDHRDKVYTANVLYLTLFNIVDSSGNVLAYYTASANEEKFNNILYGLLTLSKGFGGPNIPLLVARNSTIQFFPSGSTNVSPSGGSGGGPALPGGTTFQNLTVDSPSTLVDTFDAALSTFAFFIVSAMGTNGGEGSRTSIISATWNGSNIDFNETRTADAGGTTSPITFKVEMAAGQIQLNAYTSTDGWVVKGLRILFQNISFTNAQGPLPVGGTSHQILRKASNADYDVQWFTLTVAAITDLVATVTELNYSSGVTSSIQTQINNLTTALTNLTNSLANYLLLSGGTMSGNIAMAAHKLTGLAAGSVNGDSLRYEQLIGLYLLLSGGTMSGPIAMAGNKITGLAAASTNGDAVRYEQLPTAPTISGTPNVLYKVISIGAWNMSSVTSTGVAHGLSNIAKIRTIDVMITNDAGSLVSPLTRFYDSSNLIQGGVKSIDSTTVTLFILAGGLYASGSYSAGGNRGYVTIIYEP